MPGDAGVPPYFDWSGSTNVAGVKVLYPAPTRMLEGGAEVIGYKHAVLFPVEVIPQDPRSPVALKLAVELGICRDICVPATAAFDLALPPARKTVGKDAIAAAIERVPRPERYRRPTDPALRSIKLHRGESGARLTLGVSFHGRKNADVFVEAPDGLYVPMLRTEAKGADGITRFGTELSDDLVRDLKGKTLTFTLVSEAGALENKWTFP